MKERCNFNSLFRRKNTDFKQTACSSQVAQRLKDGVWPLLDTSPRKCYRSLSEPFSAVQLSLGAKYCTGVEKGLLVNVLGGR